jgi:hypothetical protein
MPWLAGLEILSRLGLDPMRVLGVNATVFSPT